MRITSRWRRAVAAVSGAAAIAVALGGCTGGDPGAVASADMVTGELPTDTVEQLQGAVEHAMAATGSSGAIVGVWVPWAGAWVEGLGATAHQGGSDVTTDMAFRAGTVTRAMTCDALYGLVADGVVDLDDTVAEWVPSTPDLDDVTLRHLCDNTSGLGTSYDVLETRYFATPERRWNAREVAAAGLGEGRTEPGVGYTDSDAGYLLLGMALHNATGRSAAQLIAEYATGPLGLEHTRLPGGEADAPGEPALRGYQSFRADREAGCVAPTEYTTMSASFGYTDRGVVTTIEDLGRYGRGLAARVQDGDARAARWSAPVAVDPEGQSWYQYAGGTFLAGTLVGQQGKVPGYLAGVYSDIGTGLTVAAVLNNSAGAESTAGDLAKELAAIVSKTPARDGENAPEFGLPWTAEDYHKRIADRAVCPIE